MSIKTQKNYLQNIHQKLSQKNKILLLLCAFLFSILAQMIYFQPNYTKILKSHAHQIAEITKTEHMLNVNGFYQPTETTASLYFEDVNQTVSEIFIQFAQPYGYERYLYLFYTTNNLPFNLMDCIESPIFVHEKFISIQLNQEEYSDFRLDFTHGKDIPLPLENIFLLEESITPQEKLLSKLSLFYTLLFTPCFYLLGLLSLDRKEYIQTKSALFCVPLFYFAFFSKQTLFSDDVVFFENETQGRNLWEFTVHRYTTWSSRQIIEAFIYFLKDAKLLWAILTTALCLLTLWTMTQLVSEKSSRINWVCLGLFSLAPMIRMSEVGWIATSTNYFWVLSLGLFSLLGIKRCLDGNTLTKKELFIYCLATLYGANQEQGAALLLGFHLVFICYFKYKKSPIKNLLPQTLISALSLLYHLTCVGNDARQQIQIPPNMSDFFNLSFLSKIELGCSSTLYFLVLEYHTIFFTTCIFLLITAVVQKNWITLSCITVPFLISNLFGAYYTLLHESIPLLQPIKEALTDYGTLPSLENLLTFLPLILITTTFLFFLLGVFFLFQDKLKGAFSVLIILAGFASRIIMGLSPTIWMSGDRTYIFFHFSLLIVALFVYEELTKQNNKLSLQLTHAILGLYSMISIYELTTSSYYVFGT